MSAVFGIHVGNTSMCLASNKDGKIDIVANDFGDRVMPAVVGFHESEEVIGLPAKNSIFRNAKATVTENKRLMNDQISDEEWNFNTVRSSCTLIKEDSILYQICQNMLAPQDIHTRLLKKLFEIADFKDHSESEHFAVICVPSYFSQSSREAISRCTEEAGFEVLQVINEPSSAMLAYNIGMQNAEQCKEYCLIYRLGGGTLDVTLILSAGGMYSIIGSVHKYNIGGNAFTKILAEFLASEFKQKWKLDPQESRKSMAKLMHAAETCKHVLSTMSTGHCFVESLCDGVDLSINITRARFESLILPVLQDYINPVCELMEQTELKTEDVTKVIFCGGSMKIPKLQLVLADKFPSAEVLHGLNPDEVIAIGAAKQASLLGRSRGSNIPSSVEVSALSKPLYIKWLDEYICIVNSDVPLPIKCSKTLLVPNNNEEIHVALCEYTPENEGFQFLGKIVLTDVESPTKINFELFINSVGAIHASLSDAVSKKKAVLKLDPPQP